MNIIDYLQGHQIILLFLIIALGFLFGRIRLFGFSFESSGILFVAMLFGHYGFTLNSDFQTLGLIFFIYAIGLQAGPSIFNISKKQSFRLYGLVFLILSTGAIITALAMFLFDIPKQIAVGLFSGAMTSTPGLAAAQEATNSTQTSLGYGIAYPLGVVGVLLFIKVLPKILRVNIKDEEDIHLQEGSKHQQTIIRQNVVINNESLQGKTLRELNFSQTMGVLISRAMRGYQVMIPSPDLPLFCGDIVRIVGDAARIKAAIPFLGKKTQKEIPEVDRLESRRFVITNKEIVGQTIASLDLPSIYNINITRIRRGGFDFLAEPGQKLNWGDRVRVVGNAGQMDAIRNLFGDEMKKIEYGNIFSIIFGILVGIFCGLIPFSIGKVISFNLGITGGVLIAGLVLSNRGKVGPVIWQVPVPIISFMRELGLILFLAVVGIKAGADIVHILEGDGLLLIGIGICITLLPMIFVSILARSKYKMLFIELGGLLSGGMTSTPGLTAATAHTESQAPLIMYATVYPFAMILMMIWVKILLLL